MKKNIRSIMVMFSAVFIFLAMINISMAADAGSAAPAPAPAFATPANTSMTGPFYMGILVGYNFGTDLDYDARYAPSYDLDSDNTWTVGAKFGYTMPFAKFFAVEFEYRYFAPDVDRTIVSASGGDYIAVEGDLSVHNFLFNFIGKYPKGRIHPFLGIGFGFSYIDFSGKVEDRYLGNTTRYSVSNNDTAFATQILAGVNFEISKNFSIDLAYRYFITSSITDDDDDDDDHHHHDDHHDTEGIEIKSSVVSISLNYHF